MRIELSVWLCVAFSALFALSAQAETVEVCDQAELANAIDAVSAGQEIVLCDREWQNTRIALVANGTVENPIVIRGNSPGKTILTGSSSVEMGGSHIVVSNLVWTGEHAQASTAVFFRSGGQECSQCRLTESSFNMFNPPDRSEWVEWVRVWGQDNEIDHNYFDGKSTVGPVIDVHQGDKVHRVDKEDRHHIHHNYFSRPPITANNGGEVLRVGTSGRLAHHDSLTVVESNYFHKADGEVEIIKNSSSGNVYRQNTFVACKGSLSIRYGDRVRVEGNYFFGEGVELTGGVRVSGEGPVIVNNYFEGLNPGASKQRAAVVFYDGDSEIDPDKGYYFYPPTSDVLVAHNTVVNTTYSLMFGSDTGSVAPRNITIENNILQNPGENLTYFKSTPSGVRYENNLIDGELDEAPASSNIFAAAELERIDGMYRPTQGSPAVDALGPASSALDSDIDLQSRADGRADIGADEVVDGARRPPTGLCDVGPTRYSPGKLSACVSLLSSAPLPPQIQ